MQKQPALVLPGAIQMRIKSSQSSTPERLSQTKSMVLPDPDILQKPISRHRRNQSQYGHESSAGLQTALKGQYLNKAKIAESGKKIRKNWTCTWVVLSSDQLLFYKESKQEAVANLKPGGKADGVDLCGAAIEWTTEKSSRKNVIQISTPTGHEFLLQADDFPTISKWHDAIKKAICSMPRGSGGQSYGRAAFQRSNSTECLSRPTCEASKPRAKETKSEHRRSIMFKLNYSASDSADKNGVKNRLKKFISRRPSMKTLQEKGIIKVIKHTSGLVDKEIDLRFKDPTKKLKVV